MEGSESRLTGSVCRPEQALFRFAQDEKSYGTRRQSRRESWADECVRPYVVRGYNRCFQFFNFSLGKDTHWHSTKIFMNSGARS